MAELPVYNRIPPHLAHRSGLKKEGRVPVAAPVAAYRYRHHDGYSSCELFERSQTRPLQEAQAARERRLAALGGQFSLF